MKLCQNFFWHSFISMLVELEGLEPSSKRGTNELSTCVVSTWLSGSDRQETANHNLSL